MSNLKDNATMQKVVAENPLSEDQVEQMQDAVASNNPDSMIEALKTVPPELLHQALEVMRTQGNDMFKAGQYKEAIGKYTESLSLVGDHRIFSNRAACYIKMKKFDDAIADAEQAIRLRPDWAKGWYRKGCALVGQQKGHQAMAFLRKAMELDPNDKDVKAQFQHAEQMAAMLDQYINADMNDPMRPPEPFKSQIDESGEILSDRPTFHYTQAETAYHPDSRWFQGNTVAKGIQKYLETHCSLNAPREVIAMVDDYGFQIRLLAAVLKGHLKQLFRPKVAILGCSAGILPLASSVGGALETYNIDHYIYEYNITRAVIEVNKFKELQKMYATRLKNMQQEQRRFELAQFTKDLKIIHHNIAKADYTIIPEKCDVLVVNLPHHSLLGTGWIPAVQNARKFFLHEDAAIFPSRAKVYAVGVELTVRSHLDLSDFTDAYSWSLNVEPIDLRTEAHTVLTEPFEVFDFVMRDVSTLRPIENKLISPKVIRSGRLHGFVYYYDLYMGDSVLVSNSSDSTYGKQAIYYVDALKIGKGEALPLKVSHNKTRITFNVGAPTIPRITYIDNWYRAAINDAYRTRCFSTAISRYCATASTSGDEVTVLTLCCGAGLLAAECAQNRTVKHVYATEKLPQLANTAKAVMQKNGVADKVTVVNKDPRNLTWGWAEYGKSGGHDMYERPDLVVLELFDCALIGEGAVHYSEWVRQNITTPRKAPTMIPRAATLYGMLVEYRSSTVDSVDVGGPLNLYRPADTMQTVDLRRKRFKQMSEPFEVFGFDFYTATTEGERKVMDVPLIDNGIVSAVAVWFDLHLDLETTYSTSPFGDEDTYIQQGLQYLPEVKCTKGASFPLVAGMQGADVMFGTMEDKVKQTTGLQFLNIPRADPRWVKHQQTVSELGKGLAKRMEIAAEFKQISNAATRLAIQPANFGLNGDTCARFAHAMFMPQ
eukprot:NODE_208_length_2940_cov_90.488108_g193_i0.p1 GENE.NODE_208_length_2940_cov_90.488108_g193_i0~~NODE_208_length_2940_cov_90.488108_g193_i0.p1  ORF type:complete len:939 (-),score=162.50 NODE_208_length_2940_cov_90.488108_g193_i0:62-2878(-)